MLPKQTKSWFKTRLFFSWLNRFQAWFGSISLNRGAVPVSVPVVIDTYMDMFVEVSYDGFDNGYCLKVFRPLGFVSGLGDGIQGNVGVWGLSGAA